MPEDKSQSKKLTDPQVRFLQGCRDKPRPVWPGTDTQVANNLKRLGFVKIESYMATITDSGLAALQTKQGKDSSND